MITRKQIREWRGPRGIAEMFAALGYPVALSPVNPAAWTRAGIAQNLHPQWPLRHASRVAGVDLFILGASPVESRQACVEFLQSWRRWNALSTPLIAAADETAFAIHAFDQRGRPRRLESAFAVAGGELLDRLRLLERVAHQPPWELPRQIEKAMERESVTRGFFDRFRGAVARIAGEFATQCAEPAEAIRDQALLVLSRILFLYFLQQKGWLDGNRRFIADRVRSADDCFQTVFRPLFFGCLNTPVPVRDAAARKLGRIPYLNGGLFEPSAFEQRNSVTLAHDVVVEILDATFERYSFCIDEEDEQGVHVDPEMLGKVFENLMAEEERLATGSFYTPKPIVDSLAEEAIHCWAGEFEPKKKLERLEGIRILDPACGSGAFLLASLQILERLIRCESEKLGRKIDSGLRKRIVERSLFGVDVKPEAVRLCELRLWLSIVSGSNSSAEEVEPLPNLDRNILQGNALLGPLDFLAGRNRSAVYRGWSFALKGRSELEGRYRHALPAEKPALCRAMRESDQSLAVALLASALKADQEELNRISTPCAGLFGPQQHPDSNLRPLLERRMAETERLLARAQEGRIEFFAFDLHFAHVIAQGGFDVVIGNPPWVRTSRIEPALRKALADRFELFQAGRSFDQSDLCLAFWEKGWSLAAEGGVVGMLLPSKIGGAGYAAALRRRLSASQIVAIRDWTGQSKDLFDADTFPIALTVRKAGLPPSSSSIDVRIDGQRFSIPQDRLSSSEPGSSWQLIPPALQQIFFKIQKRFPSLEETLGRKPLMGLKTGDNERFFLGDIEPHNGSVRLPSLNLSVPAQAVARCVRGRDLSRWTIGGATWMLLPPEPRGVRTSSPRAERPALGTPVSRRLSPRAGRARGGQDVRTPRGEIGARSPAWVDRVSVALGIDRQDFRLAYVQPQHFGIKVVWKDVSRGLQAAVLGESARVWTREFPLVPNQTLYMLEAATLQEAHLLAALLNSTIFNALAVAVADRAKDSHYRYFGATLAGIALPSIDPRSSHGRFLAGLSRRAHRGHAVSAEIDEAVRQLYRITPAELRLLSSFLARRLGL